MKKETFENLLWLYDGFKSLNHDYNYDLDLDEEVSKMRDVISDFVDDVAKYGFGNNGHKHESGEDTANFMKALAGLAATQSVFEELEEIRTHIAIASEIHGDIKDFYLFGNWPTWGDGSLVKIGERAVSLRGPLEIIGIEVCDDGWSLFGFADLGDVDEVTGKSYRTRYIIDQGSDTTHPTMEGEYCDFWPESEEDALEYYGKDVLYKNTGRAHLLEEEDGQKD
jgi:hypothetical protein